MAFSLIDEADPDREFSFTLGLAASDDQSKESYSVDECTPQVPELPKLLEQLNSNPCS